MIIEALILGMSLVSIVGCWAHVQKHRLTVEFQKHKMNVELKMLEPAPDPVKPKVEPPPPGPFQQSLTALLARRHDLEERIDDIRNTVIDSTYSEKRFETFRAHTIAMLENARKEHQELVLEQVGLLEMAQEATREESNHEKVRLDSSEKSMLDVDSIKNVSDVVELDEESRIGNATSQE